MKSICVYAGSAAGTKEVFTNNAIELGNAIANYNYSMVYGGGSNGLMGVVANAALSNGAEVTGIITDAAPGTLNLANFRRNFGLLHRLVHDFLNLLLVACKTHIKYCL